MPEKSDEKVGMSAPKQFYYIFAFAALFGEIGLMVYASIPTTTTPDLFSALILWAVGVYACSLPWLSIAPKRGQPA